MKKKLIRLASILLLASTASSTWAVDLRRPAVIVLQTGGGPSFPLESFSLGVDIETVLRTGGGGLPLTTPGNFEWLPLRITAGFAQVDNPYFLLWEEDVLQGGGSSSLRNLSIQILDQHNIVLYQWDLTDVWLSEVETFFSDDAQVLGTQQYTLIVSSAVWITSP